MARFANGGPFLALEDRTGPLEYWEQVWPSPLKAKHPPHDYVESRCSPRTMVPLVHVANMGPTVYHLTVLCDAARKCKSGLQAMELPKAMGGDWLMFGKVQRPLTLCTWCRTNLYELATVKGIKLATVKGIKRKARDMDSDSDPCASRKTSDSDSERSRPSDSD